MAKNNTPLDVVQGNGHTDEDIPETPEQLEAVRIKLQDLKRGDGILTISKEQLSLMQAMFYSSTEEYREQQMWRMCSFVDDEEAADHVAAYYEAKELGMDTSFNVANMFALCSANRKGGFTSNLIAILSDVLQHGKWAMNQKQKGQNGNVNSPLS